MHGVICLADNLAALPATVAQVNGSLHHRLALDDRSGTPEMPIFPQQPTQDGTAAADGPPATGRARRKATGAA